MKRYIAISFIIIGLLSIFFWALNRFLIPILPINLKGEILLFFAAISAVIILITKVKSVIEFTKMIIPEKKKKKKWVSLHSLDTEYSCEIGISKVKNKKVLISISQLRKHFMAVGNSGSGRTFCQSSLMIDLWKKFSIPFIAVDCRNTFSKYYHLENTLFEFYRPLYMPYNGINLNPFSPLKETVAGERREFITSCFEANYGQSTSKIIAEAVELSYMRYGISMTDIIDSRTDVPAMRDFYDEIKKLKVFNYNILPTIHVLSKKMAVSNSDLIIENLSVPVIIDLTEYAYSYDGLTAIFLSFILDAIKQQFKPELETDRLRTVIFIDEIYEWISQNDKWSEKNFTEFLKTSRNFGIGLFFNLSQLSHFTNILEGVRNLMILDYHKDIDDPNTIFGYEYLPEPVRFKILEGIFLSANHLPPTHIDFRNNTLNAFLRTQNIKI